ncbi:hypothetical protein BDZ94DRAFT_1175227 [Collybia nuda]|uniref:G domain-containing protein n=1 Tax=Collybia nuda TaxID=64659 RepID=A0A9P5XW10_9AGAR|nr:hypothetical protein BDZ94DRAFT_1175227 [Collybia nuda]
MKKIILLIASFTEETQIRRHPDFISLYKIHKSLVPIEDEPWISTPPPDNQVPDVQVVNPGPIFEVGKRFRILIIGRSNVGKTTILKKIHPMGGDPIIHNSKGEPRGEHDIEDDMVFSGGPPFIYHDSRGFEAGSMDEFRKVRDFLTKRAKTKELADIIDVIWYCIAMDDMRPISYTEKQFFSVLGTDNVPVVVVFTKCEALESVAIEALEDAGHTFDEAIEQAPKYVEENFKNTHKEFEAMKYPPRGHVYLQELDRPKGDCQELLECTAKVLGYDTLQDLNNAARKGSSEPALKH